MPAMRRRIVLHSATRRKLKHEARWTVDARYRTRCLIVLRADEGWGPVRTAAALDCSRSHVDRTLRRFEADGWSGLMDRREDNGRRKTDEDYVVRSVAEASDSRLLRIATSSVDEGDALHAELHPLLERLELEHEWHRYGYVAIKVSTDELPSPLADFIEQWSGAGRLRHEFA